MDQSVNRIPNLWISWLFSFSYLPFDCNKSKIMLILKLDKACDIFMLLML